jgi:hypothetical protein
MRTHPGRARYVVACCALLTLASGGVAAAGQQSGAISASTKAQAAIRPTVGQPGRPGLTPAQAAARARATGRRVVVSSLTTPTMRTTANPNGTFILTQTLVPTRTREHGRWVPLDAKLERAAGRLSPAASSSPLSLSDGAGPLAVLSTAGRTLALSWPGRLPVPVVSGATATYRNVLPGVDLAVTADTQGGMSDTLIIRTAAAAANPALRSLKLTASVSRGLRLSADPAGNLIASAGRKAQPAFTAQAPLMWDSARPPAGQATTRGPGGLIVSANSGLPAFSSATAAGVGAHVTRIRLSVRAGTIVLSPPGRALTRPGNVFPMYLDPTFHNNVGGGASNWTQVDSGFAGTSYWKESSDLQLGDCDFSGCNGLGVVRDFFTMPVSSSLFGADIDWSHLYTTDVWSDSCTKEAVQLWSTGTISSATTWNHQPGFDSDLQSSAFAFGYSSSCKAFANDNTWTITSKIASDASGHFTNQTFGFKAGSESNDLYWKQFDSGSKNITISTEYNDTPSTPTGLAVNSACGSSTSPSIIGNDDVTISAKAADKDADNSLTTRFVVLNSDGSTAYDSQTAGSSPVTGDTATAPITIRRAAIQAWHSDGTTKAYTYHVKANTTDQFSLTSGYTGYCYFTYNPTGPAAPAVSASPASAALGQPVTATFTPPPGCSPTTSPCPTSYSYQTGAGKPVTATVGAGSCTAATCAVTITVTQLGPITISVAGISSGNPGGSASTTITGTTPAAPYADGYFSGGTYPDLLSVGTGSDPSLWVSPGAGNGSLGAPVDIGSVGTGVNPGTDGPTDWTGAEVLHGDFTGDEVQDAIAYYPAGAFAGTGELIPGIGIDATLEAEPANTTEIPSVAWSDPFFANPSDVPLALTAAGNASQTSTGVADLIGTYGDSGSGYELDIFTSNPGSPGSYGYSQTLSSGSGPDGNPWNDFSLATAQPGADASAAVLFALDTTNGQLWESVNPGCPAACSATSLIGTAGTWTQLTVPWGSAPPALASADINHAGQTELWTVTGKTATAYTLSGTTITSEASGSPLTRPNDDWPLADGQSNCPGTSPATVTDTVTTATASLAGGFSWTCDNTFDTVLSLDGSTGFVVPPAATVPTTDTTPSISIWFKTSTADGVLVSIQNQAVSVGNTITGGYDPALYVGTDGKLYAEWWPMTGGAVGSTTAVDDGLWHHVVLTASGGGETFYLDGQLQVTASGTPSFSFANPTNFTIGAGYIGGNWPNEIHYKQSGNTGYRDFFDGEIADVTLSS